MYASGLSNVLYKLVKKVILSSGSSEIKYGVTVVDVDELPSTINFNTFLRLYTSILGLPLKSLPGYLVEDTVSCAHKPLLFSHPSAQCVTSVSYTHLTLPTNREV